MQSQAQNSKPKVRQTKKSHIPKRPFWLKLHTIIASFFLPIAAIFLLSGIFLVTGVRSRTEPQTYDLVFTQQIDNSDSAKLAIIENELDARGISHMLGSTYTRRGELNWRNSSIRASLRLNTGRTTGTLTIQHASFLSKLNYFHFAVTPLHEVIAIATVIASTIIFLTGVVLAIQVKALRRTAIIWTALGTAFTIMVLIIA
ncbi:hypothetical protein JD969_14605 [Planctomycetota bacterium]|nr:hypothetical protein JD969_14605 [Planctomycetota bacterium]